VLYYLNPFDRFSKKKKEEEEKDQAGFFEKKNKALIQLGLFIFSLASTGKLVVWLNSSHGFHV
jgi:hypothetical protein